MAITVNHYSPGEPDQIIHDISNATKGAKNPKQLLQKARGGANICVVLPWYLPSMDDMRLFICEGEGSKSEQFFLVDKHTNRGTQSHFTESTVLGYLRIYCCEKKPNELFKAT